MHVPEHASLASWIRELIADGRLYRFYKTREWLDLRSDVLADHNNECERCAERGAYSRAQTVHHEFDVKDHPSMALTRYVEGVDGAMREVLHPLCNRCHNEVHGRVCSGSTGHLRTDPKTRGEIW